MAPSKCVADVLTLATFALADGVTSLVSEELKAIDTASAGAISDIISAGGFEGKQASLHSPRPPQRARQSVLAAAAGLLAPAEGPCGRGPQYVNCCVMPCPCAAYLQGQQSKAVRVGSAPGLKAKSVALVGVGKKLATTADWGASPAQVRTRIAF